MMLSWAGGRTRKLVEKWMGKAGEMIRRLNDPYLTAYYDMKWGLVHWGFGEWQSNVQAMDRSAEIVKSGKTSLIFFRTEVRFSMLHSLMLMGRWKEYIVRVEEYRQEAQRLGNRYAIYAMLVKSYLAGLMRGEPEKALSDIQAGHDAWRNQANFLADFLRVCGRVESRLYTGDASGAQSVLSDEKRVTVANVFQQARYLETTFLLMEQLHGRVKLALAEQTPEGGWWFGKRSRLLRQVSRHARTIEKRKMPWSNPLAKLLRAGVANVRGDTAGAVTALAQAEADFDAADMAMYSAAARRQRGLLLGGDEGVGLIASADEVMTVEGVVEPDRIAAMLAPGFAQE